MTPLELRSLWSDLERIDSAESCEALSPILAATTLALGFQQFAYFFRIQIDSELAAQRSLSNVPLDLLMAIQNAHEPALNPVRRSDATTRAPREWTVYDTFSGARISGVACSTQRVTPAVATLCLWSTGASASMDWTCLPAFGVAQLVVERVTHAMEPVVIHEAIGLERRLTTREVECLQWVSRGKSAWETGTILGVTEHAVVFHIKNAMSKFGVQTRLHAVARARLLGFIE